MYFPSQRPPDTPHIRLTRSLQRSDTIVDLSAILRQANNARPPTPWADIIHPQAVTMHSPTPSPPRSPSPGHTAESYQPRRFLAYPIPQQGETRIRPVPTRELRA